LWKDTSIDSFLLAKSPLITFVKATNACGTAYDTITIKAFQSQAINLVSDSILCKGKSIVFNINIQGKNSYLWQDGTTSPQYTINQPGIYSITVTDTNSCQRSASVKITNLANPSISLPNDTIACNAISLPLQIQCAGCNYNWSNGATSATITADKEGTYSVTASNVCGNTKDSIHVGIDISPKIKTIGDTTICKGTSIVYSIGLEGNYSYHWQDASTDSLYTISKAGTYSFTVTDPHHCSSNKLFNITENIAPKFQLPNDSSYCDSIQIPLDVSCNACLYSWNDGFTLPHYVISKAGTYIVTVSNSCGTKSDSIIVHKIDCESMLDVPSAFSPNNDNINDVLYAVGKSIEHVSFKIFNRWGQLVFESNSMSNGWDGKQNGKAAEEGVYVYYISATSIKDGHTLTQTGTITLIR
jgi:gliding motility-associated-like protein